MQKCALYLGETFEHSTARHRAEALSRLGWEVTFINPISFTPRVWPIPGIFNRLGNVGLPWLVERGVLSQIGKAPFDLVWVDGGSLVGPSLLKKLSRQGGALVNYNLDDPFGGRDGNAWRVYLKAVPFYDLLAVVREENVQEAKALGAKKVKRVFRSYDPVAHALRPLTAENQKRWASKVVFIGTWMPERGPFFRRLLELGVPLTLYGNDWEKAQEFEFLQRARKGAGLWGDDYALAIQCAKVSLCLLSKGNRDLHTQRSLEIPALGGLLCAERTREHLALYEEGKEALFWETPEECAEVCRRAIAEPEWAVSIAAAGQRKVRALKLSNDEVVASILQELNL
ncbi:MAG: glycosyltransferase [bacterium]